MTENYIVKLSIKITFSIAGSSFFSANWDWKAIKSIFTGNFFSLIDTLSMLISTYNRLKYKMCIQDTLYFVMCFFLFGLYAIIMFALHMLVTDNTLRNDINVDFTANIK